MLLHVYPTKPTRPKQAHLPNAGPGIFLLLLAQHFCIPLAPVSLTLTLRYFLRSLFPLFRLVLLVALILGIP